MPVLLVVGMRLGCLNHARLTFESIRAASRAPFAGWIANRIDPGFARADDNIATLERLLECPPLAVMPWKSPPDIGIVARAARESGARSAVLTGHPRSAPCPLRAGRVKLRDP